MTGARNVERGVAKGEVAATWDAKRPVDSGRKISDRLDDGRGRANVNDGAAPSRTSVVERPRLRRHGVALADRRFVTFRSCSGVARGPATLRRLIGAPAAALAVVVGALAGPLAASSSAAGTLDQSQTAQESGSSVDPSPLAQTFTAGMSGSLSEVDLLLRSNEDYTDPVTVEIRDTSGGAPASTVLASATVMDSELSRSSYNWIAVNFAHPATVQAGTQYAIVAYTSGTEHWGFASGDPDAGGTAWGTSGAVPSLDFAFKTYVDSAAYDFDGFFAPIDDDAVNVLKAGQGVPVKFSLGDDHGLDILAEGSPSSRPVACDAGGVLDSVEETVTAGGSGLTYDATSGIYTYTWKTDKAWAGTCRELSVTLSDGTMHTAQFKLTR